MIMKSIYASLLLAVFTIFAYATSPMRSIIVSYPEGTPDSVLSEAKSAIKSAGGMITHEYSRWHFVGFW